jgi:hypothetical protein
MIQIHLSKAGKMPCPSYSLNASDCITGSKLAKVSGSVCSKCYANKGNYRFHNVKKLRASNLEGLRGSLSSNDWGGWISVMVSSINSTGTAYFRWFDSGDLQSFGHLKAICEIATKLPQIKFWLPTHEAGFVKKYLKSGTFPPNLAVRVSAAMIDGPPGKGTPLTSTVHRSREPLGAVCRAPEQGGKCLDCRVCWDTSVPNVSYRMH